jgi:hypothetical protein
MGTKRSNVFIHDDISLIQFVIPGLTRDPAFSWIPAFAGMTDHDAINDAGYDNLLPERDSSDGG